MARPPPRRSGTSRHTPARGTCPNLSNLRAPSPRAPPRPYALAPHRRTALRVKGLLSPVSLLPALALPATAVVLRRRSRGDLPRRRRIWRDAARSGAESTFVNPTTSCSALESTSVV